MSTGPSASSIAATPARAEPASATSMCTARPSISPATERALASLRSATATRAPSAASRRAVAAPIPDAPPVTSAIRPSSRMAAQRIASAAMSDQVTVIGGSGALGSGLALRLAVAGVAGRDRLARRRPCRGSRRARARAGAGRRHRDRARERPRRRGERGRVPVRAVPQPVRDPDEPQGPSARGPAARRRHRAAGRRRVRQGDPHARRLAGIGGAAGGRDGARRRPRRRRAAHGQRARA